MHGVTRRGVISGKNTSGKRREKTAGKKIYHEFGASRRPGSRGASRRRRRRGGCGAKARRRSGSGSLKSRNPLQQLPHLLLEISNSSLQAWRRRRRRRQGLLILQGLQGLSLGAIDGQDRRRLLPHLVLIALQVIHAVALREKLHVRAHRLVLPDPCSRSPADTLPSRTCRFAVVRVAVEQQSGLAINAAIPLIVPLAAHAERRRIRLGLLGRRHCLVSSVDHSHHRRASRKRHWNENYKHA